MQQRKCIFYDSDTARFQCTCMEASPTTCTYLSSNMVIKERGSQTKLVLPQYQRTETHLTKHHMFPLQTLRNIPLTSFQTEIYHTTIYLHVFSANAKNAMYVCPHNNLA